MSEQRYRVSWEMVTPFDWPDGYWCQAGRHDHEHPTVPKGDVPEDKWRRIEKEYGDEPAARQHLAGLVAMDADGIEFVRNPQLDVQSATEWSPVDV